MSGKVATFEYVFSDGRIETVRHERHFELTAGDVISFRDRRFIVESARIVKNHQTVKLGQ